MHSWEKRDAALICQGASRVQVRRGAAGPWEKKMKRIHMIQRESKDEGVSRSVGLEIIQLWCIMCDLREDGGLGFINCESIFW